MSSSYLPNAFVFILVCFLVFDMQVNGETRRLTQQNKSNETSPFSAIFVFGDSTVDSGNNNYIPTAMRSNFYPYGKDFPNHIPTGRFSNGRLVTDFMASYLGLKDTIPPFLDPNLSLHDLITGVCFASASSGFDPLTPQLSGVISMQTQLQYFREYKSKLEMYIGKKRSEMHISKAVFLISAGTNDYIVNYFGAPIRRQTYTLSAYQNYLIQLGQQFVQGLVEEGAKKIAFVGLPPMGCVPAVITLNSDDAVSHRRCIESLSSVAADYNQMLQNNLNLMASNIHGITIHYIDIYTPLDDMIIRRPRHYGFEKVDVGCCGSGLLEAGILCNSKSIVCSDASKYVFWDSIHPSDAAYGAIFQVLRPLIDRFNKY